MLNNTLTAYAKEPLQIVNYNLGYEIKYKLEEFRYDFNIKLVNYSGYAFFTDMGVKYANRCADMKKQDSKHIKGSFLHFKRAFLQTSLMPRGLNCAVWGI